jgi:hypothetical protein
MIRKSGWGGKKTTTNRYGEGKMKINNNKQVSPRNLKSKQIT